MRPFGAAVRGPPAPGRRRRWAVPRAAAALLGTAAVVPTAAALAASPPAAARDHAAAADPAATLGNAHGAYLGGDFAGAAAGYRALLAAGHDSGWLYYDLGNAELRQDNLGEGIVALMEAESRLPRAADVRANLAWARGQAADAHEPPLAAPVWQVLFFWHFALSLAEVAWGTALAQALFWALALGALWAGPGGGPRRAAGAVSLAVALALGGSLAWRLAAPRRLAVVVAPEVRVHSAPQEEAVVRFVLHEGSQAHLGHEAGGWWQIALADGKRGWVSGPGIGRLSLR